MKIVGFWPSSLGTATKLRSMKTDTKKQNIRLSWPNYRQLPLQRTLVGMYSLAKKLSREEENSFSREIPRGQDGRVANENAGFASDQDMPVRGFRHIQSTLAPEVGRGTQKIFIWEGSAPRSNPLPVYIPSLFHIPCLELCITFNCCKMRCRLNKNHKNRTFCR